MNKYYLLLLGFFFRKGTAAEFNFNRNNDCLDTFRLVEDIDEEIRILKEHSHKKTKHSA
jgi:hypothetical protein